MCNVIQLLSMLNTNKKLELLDIDIFQFKGNWKFYSEQTFRNKISNRIWHLTLYIKSLRNKMM